MPHEERVWPDGVTVSPADAASRILRGYEDQNERFDKLFEALMREFFCDAELCGLALEARVAVR